jgi:hypothetical protein
MGFCSCSPLISKRASSALAANSSALFGSSSPSAARSSTFIYKPFSKQAQAEGGKGEFGKWYTNQGRTSFSSTEAFVR